jgi:teichuronic acid biosynthesis glycosyltransferase TuaG
MQNSSSNTSNIKEPKQGPLVSVIIPSYNYGRFVTQAVDSALAQTYANVEVIVVDDGSTDDTRARLAPYGDRIRYIYQENQGLSAARNTGIRHATGEWIAFLDSDDTWHPRKTEIQLAVAAQYPEVSLFASGECTELPEKWPDVGATSEHARTFITLEDLAVKSYFKPSSVMLRRDCLQSDAPFDTALKSVEDRDLWIRIAANGGLVRIDLPLIYYRIHGSSMCHAAHRMEEYERLVIARSFANISRIRRRFLLRSKAFSMASFSAAYMYREAGMHGKAILRLGRSFFFWPFPYKRSEVRTSFARCRLLGMSLWRMYNARLHRSKQSGALPV